MNSPALEACLTRLLTLHPKVIDLSLERIERLLEALGSPQHRLPPTIHIAGTNGKGSSVALLSSMFTAAGYRVHRYISPHLVRFNERITLAGQEIDDALLIETLERVERANGDAPITFFEITTAAAMLLFAAHPADVLLLETGLGGRLDATNVITSPLCCLITPISFDHREYLGDTLQAIAGEKAGIIKHGVPVVSAAQPSPVRNVLAKKAIEQHAPLYMGGMDWDYTAVPFIHHFGGQDTAYPAPALVGTHQLANAAGALTVLEIVQDTLPTSYAHRCVGLQTATWPARLQRLTNHPLQALLPSGVELWLDGSHNAAGGETLAAALREMPPLPLHLIVGMLSTKDAARFFAPLIPLASSVTMIPIMGMEKSTPPAILAEHVPNSKTAESAKEALKALPQTTPARVVITGSLYLAGQLL